MKKAQCKCLDESLAGVEKHMVENKPDYEAGSGTWSNMPAFMFDGSDSLPFMTFQFKKKGIKKDYDMPVMMRHCPFCGKEYLTVEKKEKQ